MSSKFDSRQIIQRSALDQLVLAAGAELDNILSSMNEELTPPLRLKVTGSDRVVSIESIVLTNPETGVKRTIPPISNLLPSFSSGSVTFPVSSGGTVTVTPGDDVILTVSSGNFIKAGLNLDANGNLVVQFGTQGASEAAATVPPMVSNTFPIGYVVLQNVAGTIQNVTNGNLYQYVGGGGGNSVITTEGDLIVGDVSGKASRLAIGANGTYLRSDGTTASWQTITGAGTYLAASGNTTLTDGDGVRTVGMTTSTSNYTVTLPAAANNTDRIITVTKVDSAAGTATVNGITLYSIRDSVTVQSDGTNWINIEVALQPRIYVLQAAGSGFTDSIAADLAGPITIPAGTYKFDLTGIVGASSASQLNNLSGYVYLTDTSNNSLGNMPSSLGGYSSKVGASAGSFDTRAYISRSDYFTIASPTAVKLRASVGTSGGSSITRYVTCSVIFTPITRVFP